MINNFLCWCVNRYADRAIVVSGPVKQHLVNSGVNSKKIKVIHNGIDSSIFSPMYNLTIFIKNGIFHKML